MKAWAEVSSDSDGGEGRVEKAKVRRRKGDEAKLLGLLKCAGEAIAKLQKENDRLREENEELRRRRCRGETEEAVEMAMSQNDALKKKVEELRKKNEKVGKLKEAIASLTNENKAAVQLIARLKAQLQDHPSTPSPVVTSRITRTYAPPYHSDEALIDRKIRELDLPLSKLTPTTYTLNGKKLSLATNPSGTVLVRTGGGNEELTSFVKRTQQHRSHSTSKKQ